MYLAPPITYIMFVNSSCGQLILRKISKRGATRCQILWRKCTKFAFRQAFATEPARGAYSASPDPQTPHLYLRGLLLREGRDRRGRRGGKGKVRGGKGRGDGRSGPPNILAWRPLHAMAQLAVWSNDDPSDFRLRCSLRQVTIIPIARLVYL